MNNRIIGASKEVVGQASRGSWDSTDLSCWAHFIALSESLGHSHMAILTRDARGGCFGLFEFGKGFFQSEAIQQGYVVTGTTECGLGQGKELLGSRMDCAARLVTISGNLIFPWRIEHPIELTAPRRAVNCRIEITLFEG